MVVIDADKKSRHVRARNPSQEQDGRKVEFSPLQAVPRLPRLTEIAFVGISLPWNPEA
jgi:hypothetical protein